MVCCTPKFRFSQAGVCTELGHHPRKYKVPRTPARPVAGPAQSLVSNLSFVTISSEACSASSHCCTKASCSASSAARAFSFSICSAASTLAHRKCFSLLDGSSKVWTSESCCVELCAREQAAFCASLRVLSPRSTETTHTRQARNGTSVAKMRILLLPPSGFLEGVEVLDSMGAVAAGKEATAEANDIVIIKETLKLKAKQGW
mmetsp:Transcript_106428/g.200423  ORF Transcript_106428/g.200423 Transcript_106428/m.200423 type:complete len:203 (-) Transcript_106428:33-641(-)